MLNKLEILYPETTYHIFNRANGWEKLFLSAENYNYFLKKYQAYISPIADTFCYCLMPNHFHFLIRIKPEKELIGYFNTVRGKSATLREFKTLGELHKQEALSRLLSQQFSNLFNSYTQAFNKKWKRKGGLLMHRFKRIAVKDDHYLRKLVHYIHYNPVESGLCNTPENWAHSSYMSIREGNSEIISVIEVISWFDDIENFVHFHSSNHNEQH